MSPYKKRLHRYAHIAVWEEERGSLGSYVHQQIEQAIESNAPEGSIFRCRGVWTNISECGTESRPTFITDFNKKVAQYRAALTG